MSHIHSHNLYLSFDVYIYFVSCMKFSNISKRGMFFPDRRLTQYQLKWIEIGLGQLFWELATRYYSQLLMSFSHHPQLFFLSRDFSLIFACCFSLNTLAHSCQNKSFGLCNTIIKMQPILQYFHKTKVCSYKFLYNQTLEKNILKISILLQSNIVRFF